MLFEELELAGLFRIDLEKRDDERGFFARMFCHDEMEAAGLNPRVVQANNTLTKQSGTVRGLHFQRPPKAESKIIRCLRGGIWDVALDLRRDSPTFGKWTTIELTEDNRTMIYIPAGFAHGFQTLRPETELLYMHSEFYSPQHEGGVSVLDKRLAITWPQPVFGLSERDTKLPTLDQTEPITL